MKTNSSHGQSRYWEVALFVGSLLFFSFLSPSVINAQDVSQTPSKPMAIQTDDLLRSQGKLLSEGYNLSPVGVFGVKTYRLEEVALPQPVEFGRGKRRQKLDSVLRLTITGESFSPGVYKIWIDDNELSNVDYHPQRLSVIIFDRSVLEQMATLAVTYESQPAQPKIVLPERLSLPGQVLNALLAREENYTVSIRRVPATLALHGKPGVQIVITKDEPFEIRNLAPVLRIGDREFTLSEFAPRDLHTVIFTLTSEEFADLKDGDKLRLKEDGAGRTVGRIRKEPRR